MGKRNHDAAAREIAANIARSLKTLRAARRFSLDDVAERAGLTKSHVWEIEQGNSANPTITTCVGLSRALGVSVGELAGLSTSNLVLHPDALRIALDIDLLLRAPTARATGKGE